MRRRVPLVIVAGLLAGCLRPPVPLVADGLEDVGVAAARAGTHEGSQVRWGGTIVGVTPGEDETCFEVVSHPLDLRARPLRTDTTDGRFLACVAGFYDPAVYAPERSLTAVGRVAKPVTRDIGDHSYRYATLAADGVYLWPKRTRRSAYYGGGFYWGYPSFGSYYVGGRVCR